MKWIKIKDKDFPKIANKQFLIMDDQGNVSVAYYLSDLNDFVIKVMTEGHKETIYFPTKKETKKIKYWMEVPESFMANNKYKLSYGNRFELIDIEE